VNARHLHAVDAETGEVVEQDLPTVELLRQQISELELELRGKRSQITRLKNENARLMGVEPEADDIMDVLSYWREVCMPGASIVVGSERWKAVRARLRETDVTTKKLLYTPAHLKAAVAGVMMSEFHVSHRRDGYLDAASIFSDSKKVDAHLARAIGFKQRNGISALTLIDELGGKALDWLALRCSCDALMVEHLHDVYAGRTTQGIKALPCPRTGCPHFDFFNANVDLTLAELDERAALERDLAGAA
jgi:hypothetical protein